MKITLAQSAVLGCSLLAFSLTASAQGNGDTNKDFERFSARFVLTATPDAPEGAKGSATIKSQKNNGDQAGTLSLRTQGLDPGDYTVNGVLASDGSTVTLGTFTIDDPNTNTNGHRRTKGKVTIDLPADVEVSDVNQLIVADAGDVAMLTGDLASGKSQASLNASTALTPGDAAPDATGFAKLKSSVKKGQRKDHFTLAASGVPAESTFTVMVDGTDAGTVTSNKSGRVLVKELPEGLESIGTVQLVDADSAEVLRADF